MAGIIYVMGIGLSRMTVLLLGALVARQLGHDDYAQFVLFLAASNLLTNLSLMGVVPRILSLPRDEDRALMALQFGGFLSFISVFLLALGLFIFGWQGLEKFAGQKPWVTGIAMFLYSGGYFCLSLSSALQNRLGLHAQAGFAWFIFALLSLVAGAGAVFWHQYQFFILALSGCTAIMGTSLWLKESKAWRIFKHRTTTSTALGMRERLRSSFRGMLQAFYSGLFGLPFLLVFFLIGQQVNSIASSNDKAVFFLGFQLFAVTLFMPGVLGNIFVPRLSQVVHAEKKALMQRLSRLYLFLGLGWVLGVYLILPWLFEIYAIEPYRDSMAVILTWQLAGVLAAMGALHNQLLVANRRYAVLLAGSLIWAAIVYAFIGIFRSYLVWGSVVGILVAYAVLQVFYGYKNAYHWRLKQARSVPLIYFLANPYSPHVRHWEELLQLGGYSIQIYSAQGYTNSMPLMVNSPVKTMLPLVGRTLPAFLRYGLAGLCLRFQKLPANGCFHAHNTSGYGFMALLSGKPYILTTYGSEIFQAKERGRFYSFLIRRILTKATLITSASASMTACLKEQFKLPVAKIYEFNLGVSETFSFNPVERVKKREMLAACNEEPVWMINRRVRPLYHTLEVMEAFIRFRESHGLGHLIVLEGDSDPGYFKQVERYADQKKGIHLLKGFFSQQALAAFLSAADFSISVPETDQMSCSILESAACGAIPLLAALEAYEPFRAFSRQFPIQNPNNGVEYDAIFDESYRLFCEGAVIQLRQEILERIQPFKLPHHLLKIPLLYQHCANKSSEYTLKEVQDFMQESEAR